MAIDTNAQAFTDAEMLTLVRAAIIQVAVAGQSYSIAGKTFTRAGLGELRKLEEEIIVRIDDAADDSGGGIALVQYGERV